MNGERRYQGSWGSAHYDFYRCIHPSVRLCFVRIVCWLVWKLDVFNTFSQMRVCMIMCFAYRYQELE